jgi:hypothetical protein
MVDVRVGKHERFYFCRIEIKVPVFFKGLLPAALEHSTLEHYRVSVDRKNYHRPGDRLRGAMELEFHDEIFSLN